MAEQQTSRTAYMPTSTPEAIEALETYLCKQWRAKSAEIHSIKRLTGGAIQENWLLDCSLVDGKSPGQHQWVLRTNAQSIVEASMSRPQEYAVLRHAFRAGVTVPEPLMLCEDPEVIGRDFFIMEALKGTAAGHILSTDKTIDERRPEICEALGSSLGNLHSVSYPSVGLEFMAPPPASPALASIEEYRSFLDTLTVSWPVLEWGLRWCEVNAPTPVPPCLVHRDYRTGNYMVADGTLSGILDWEFAAWGDPREDIGWFTARCWRFARPDQEAGGIGDLDDFLRGYQSRSALEINRQDLTYWQVMAHLRWAIIALQQAERYLTAGEDSLELALTGRMLPELEQEILVLTGGAI